MHQQLISSIYNYTSAVDKAAADTLAVDKAADTSALQQLIQQQQIHQQLIKQQILQILHQQLKKNGSRYCSFIYCCKSSLTKDAAAAVATIQQQEFQ